MYEQTIFNVLTILAIVTSPLVAVSVQRKLDEGRAGRQRKLAIFRSLMTSRASGLSPTHVEALNSIDVEFDASHAEQKKVIHKWKEYLDHLNQPVPDSHSENDAKVWIEKKGELLAELLLEMGRCLGFSFDKVTIKRSSYYPRAFGEFEFEATALRKAALEIFAGKRPLSVRVTNGVDSATG